MAKMRQFGWLTGVDVIILTVSVIALTVQVVNFLTPSVDRSAWVESVLLGAIAAQYILTLQTWRTVVDCRANERLRWRLWRQTSEAFSSCPPVSGTAPGFDELFIHQYWLGEEHIALLLTCQGHWTLCMWTHHQVPVVIGNEAVRTIHEAWQVDREAAVVTARLLCQPAVVLWLESAEVVW